LFSIKLGLEKALQMPTSLEIAIEKFSGASDRVANLSVNLNKLKATILSAESNLRTAESDLRAAKDAVKQAEEDSRN
jgi:chromosome segregation ATPase